MTFSVCSIFAALLCLCAPASCAPTAGYGLQGACADVQLSSRKLNNVTLSAQPLIRGHKEENDQSITVPWMEAKDKCDPAALQISPALCIAKILSVLKHYMPLVEAMADFETFSECSDFATNVRLVIEELHEDLSTCVKLKGAMDHVQIPTDIIPKIDRWREDMVCHVVMDRLVSFSILTARVFAVGDPALHTKDSPQMCLS